MSMSEEQSVETVGDEGGDAAGLAGQLAEANEQIARMSRDLEDLQTEQMLTQKLVAAGAVDLEAAVLMAKARLEGSDPAQVDECLAGLRKEKAYLFPAASETTGSRKTAGVKDRVSAGRAALEQAAGRAVKTGKTADLLHYMKLRRSLK